MRFSTLDQWLAWQQKLHAQAIDLGLERVREVADRLAIESIAGQVVTVAGTNGKGSTVAAYEAFLCHAGYRVASYSSPHILRYNERIRRNREPVSDAELCAAFDAVEAARGDTSLTYFEYGTLAAFVLMRDWRPDFALLEVGLGGRLDAVNIIDADLAHLTPIALDHQAWLGDDREQIGREKAGVLRRLRPVVVNEPQPPRSVLEAIERLECPCLRLGRDYRVETGGADRFTWIGADRRIELVNGLAGAHQQANLAGVVAGLSWLVSLPAYSDAQIRAGLRDVRLAGRFQPVTGAHGFRLYADVGHNPDAARVLADCVAGLERAAGGRVVVMLGMLDDKDAAGYVGALRDVVDAWWLVSLGGERGLGAAELGRRIAAEVAVEREFAAVGEAYTAALRTLDNRDIMLVCGSFLTVEQLLRESSGDTN